MSGDPTTNGRSPNATPASAQRVLVTGAAGFIGSHLCDRLLDEGYGVWGMDNFDDSYPPARKRENLSEALEHPSMRLVEGDVRDRVLVDGLMSDISFDAVVHLAARSGSHASLENPELTFDVNVRGTLAVLEAMRRHGVPALLFASSASVYGDGSGSEVYREDSAADRPLSPYAASKRTGELLCHTYHHLHGLTVHCLRLCAVYGPRQRPDRLVHRLARQLEDGGTFTLPDEWTGSRDHTFVDDIVDGISLSLERANDRDGKGPEYHIINLCSGESAPDREVIDALINEANVPASLKHVRGQPGDASQASVPTERAGELLGYRPRVALEEGLAEFVRWFRRHDAVEDGSPARPGPASEKTIG